MRSRSSLAIELSQAAGIRAGGLIGTIIADEIGNPPNSNVLRVEITADDELASVQLGTGLAVSVTKDEAIQALAADQLLLTLVLSKLIPGCLEGVDLSFAAAYQQLEAIKAARPRISFSPAEIVTTPQLERARRVLRSQRRVALVGPSSSGKTVVAESLIDSAGAAERIWLDCADPTVGIIGLALNLCALPNLPSRAMIVMDDVQCAPGLGRFALELLSLSGLLSAPNLGVIVSTWPDGLEVIERWFGHDSVVRTSGVDACRKIIQFASPTSGVAEQLLVLANGDALLAELATDSFANNGNIPTRDDLAAGCFGAVTGGQALSSDELEALWEVSCLGMFEIDARLDLITPVDQSTLDGLIRKRVIRRKNDFVFFGHRSAARLVTAHLQRILQDGSDRSPIRLAVRYLRRAGESQIRQTLDRLDLVALADDQDQFGAAFLAHCWSSVKTLVSHLGSMVREDATWGDNVASAIFAGEALAELGLENEWRLIAEYVRSRWILRDDSALPEHTSGETAEADDFRAIQLTMAEEDRLDPAAFRITASEVDIDRFHRTWVLGLLAGFEGKALVADLGRVKEIRRMIEVSQQPDGSFYPSRVPWITARVCLGLSALGESVATSPILQRASEWLRRRAPVGPFRFGSWRSGTGTWNTELQVTAMTLLALGRMGVEPSDRGVQSALAFLKDGRSEWYRPGKEIDCSLAIEAALVLGDTWRDFSSELRSLLEWAEDSRAWADTKVLASVSQDESSKVPAVTEALISVIWETVQLELPLLFQGVVGRNIPVATARLSSASRRDILRKLEHIRQVIDQAIKERHSISSRGQLPAVIAEHLRKLAIQDQECRAIQELLADDQLGGMSTSEIFIRINALGADVLGAAWEDMASL